MAIAGHCCQVQFYPGQLHIVNKGEQVLVELIACGREVRVNGCPARPNGGKVVQVLEHAWHGDSGGKIQAQIVAVRIKHRPNHQCAALQAGVLFKNHGIVVGLSAGGFNCCASRVENGALTSGSVPVCGSGIVVCKQTCQCCQAADQAVEVGLTARVHGQVKAAVHRLVKFDIATGSAGQGRVLF